MNRYLESPPVACCSYCWRIAFLSLDSRCNPVCPHHTKGTPSSRWRPRAIKYKIPGEFRAIEDFAAEGPRPYWWATSERLARSFVPLEELIAVPAALSKDVIAMLLDDLIYVRKHLKVARGVIPRNWTQTLFFTDDAEGHPFVLAARDAVIDALGRNPFIATHLLWRAEAWLGTDAKRRHGGKRIKIKTYRHHCQ